MPGFGTEHGTYRNLRGEAKAQPERRRSEEREQRVPRPLAKGGAQAIECLHTYFAGPCGVELCTRAGPHRGRDTRTGDRVDVPPKRVAYFQPGKELKELINRDPWQPVSPSMSE